MEWAILDEIRAGFENRQGKRRESKLILTCHKPLTEESGSKGSLSDYRLYAVII